MTDHANELRRHARKIGRPAGDTPAVMHAAAAHIEELERRLREAEHRVAELEAERTEREKQEPVGYIIFPKHRKAPDVRWADNTKIMEGAAIYAAPPVTAPAVGYVNALRYIAWEAAGYMDCVHAAKRAIGEMGALPPPPKIQPTEAGGG